jgi:PAS domain S-box-containing protein
MSVGAGDRTAGPIPHKRELFRPPPDAAALLRALQRISQVAESAPDLPPALRDCLALLCEAGGWRAGHVLLKAGERLASAGVFHGDFPAMREACELAHPAAGEGLPGRAVRRRSPLWGADFEGDPRARAAAECGLRSALACPIVVGPEVAGVLELFSSGLEEPDPLAIGTAEQASALLGRVLERARAARSLQLGEDIFRSLCETLPVGVALTDAQGRGAYLNPAFVRIARFGIPESSDRRWEHFVHPQDRRRALAAWKRTLQTAQPMRDVFRLLHGEELRVCEALFSPVRAPGGELRGFVVLVEDLTEKQQAQEALRLSEDRFRAVFEDAGVGLALGTPEGMIVRVNRAYAQFVGYEPEELANRHIRDVVHAEDIAPTFRHLRDLQAGKIHRFDHERRYLRRDGTQVWGRTTVTRLVDTGLLIAVVQDIDARKHAEDAIRQLSGRFLRLQDEERRRIARALHESAAQTVAALSMNLQRMERMALPPQAAEALADSLELVTQCSREIRTLSHLLHPPLLEEAGLPSSLRWYVQGFAARSNVEVELDVSGDLGRLPMELEITLFRIVQESLTNVHRHSGSESASIKLRRSGPEIVLAVEDRGIGIPADVLERVGADSSAAVGVGIAGMRERLSQLGGTLEIESGPQGTLVRARIRSER